MSKKGLKSFSKTKAFLTIKHDNIDPYSKQSDQYIGRMNIFVSDTGSYIPSDFASWVVDLGYNDADQFLKNKTIEINWLGSITLKGLDPCNKIRYSRTEIIWSPKYIDRLMGYPNFIFSKVTSNRAFAISPEGRIYLLVTKPWVWVFPIAESFNQFLGMLS